MRAVLVVSLLISLGCRGDEAKPPQNKPAVQEARIVGSAVMPAPAADPRLAADQEEYVGDVMAFTNTTKEQVRTRMKKGSVPLKEEWEAWEKEGPMTEARIKAFYKQTTNYIYELGEWHLFVPGKRASDVQLVEDMKKLAPKHILDFGGGVGLNALLLAREGLDVTLADLESTSLAFAEFRAKRHGVPLRIWKTDVEPMPPLPEYDVILALDVLEHLPKEELANAVDKLVKLKHAGTKIILSAPFGRTSVHPMHLDADEHTRRQVDRLKNELPAE